ncbi:MAG: ATP synthase gamma chain [Parcubacteria group bacterium GW2011_GWB1_36_5]|nr:MAG: ATP synthase gamma chain [Parcubacteria group bacterium GW2011_GWB1_36_5]
MAGTKEIKRRIKSVKNTKKITKAMELVAASKMKRAVASTLASRLYAEYSWEILTSIAKNVEELDHPFFNERNEKNKTNKILLILITSNRGLCGAYNAQIIKKTLGLIKSNMSKTVFDIVSIGKKGDVAMRRLNINVVASFSDLSDKISLSEVVPISKFAMDEYTASHYHKVLVAYTDFVSALTQRANIKQILPVSRTDLKELIENLVVGVPSGTPTTKSREEQKINYLFEGDKIKLIDALAEKLTRMQIYQMLLESNASEQSSRMVAMKNASEASGEMIDDLTLVFNKARQSNITREISEISAGMASVS